MLDVSKIGFEFPAFEAEVERGRMRLFVKAIGENNPIYLCEEAAKEAGYQSIPAPPTFMFVLDTEGPELFPFVKVLDMDIGKILHGSQEFEYFGMIYAGDKIAIRSTIKDIYAKKNGQLEFVVIENSYTNQDNVLVGKTTNTLVYRN